MGDGEAEIGDGRREIKDVKPDKMTSVSCKMNNRMHFAWDQLWLSLENRLLNVDCEMPSIRDASV